MGLIPACAGKTPSRTRPRRRLRAHPRMRGENNCLSVPSRAWKGSSPHARGKRFRWWSLSCPFGLIPACAGKTVYNSTRHTGQGAHPRMRGENLVAALEGLNRQGSSPHARGKPRHTCTCGLSSRLIPACAGKTFHADAVLWQCRAHPRMRGENRGTLCATPSLGGSSPHARGKPPNRR